jgi:hypothetical protein
MYRRFFLRDAGIVLGAALLWALVARRSSVPGPVGDFSGVLAGLLLGGCALLTHEWGHFLGAVLSRSEIAPGRSLRSPFSFSFDSRRNSQGRFLAMSLGGWIGTALWVWVAYAFFGQDDLASRVARGTALVSAALAAIFEIPIVARVLWTGKLPRVETQRA